MKELQTFLDRGLRLTRESTLEAAADKEPLPMTDIMTPALGESVTEATVARWTKKAGDAVKQGRGAGRAGDRQGQPGGRRARRRRADRDRRRGRRHRQPRPRCWASISAGGAPAAPGRSAAGEGARSAAAGAGRRRPPPRRPPPPPRRRPRRARSPRRSRWRPSVQRIVTENKLDPAAIAGTGKDGRITKGDALAALEARAAQAPAPRRRSGRAGPAAPLARARGAGADDAPAPDHRPPPEGGAEHRRHADHLQRGGHERGHGAAQPVQGRVREDATA